MGLVSVIIPTYKGSKALTRAIDSVLNQKYVEVEVIVVDDNVPDSRERNLTEILMKTYQGDERVRYIKHKNNQNGATARNTGIAHAAGDYIAFLDDDDYYLEDRVGQCVRYMGVHKNMVGVYVGVDVVDEDGNITMQIRPEKELEVSELLMDEMAIGTGSNIFLRRTVFSEIKGFDTRFARRQDTEFMIRVCQCERVGFITDRLIIKSVNGTSNLPAYAKMKDVLNLFFEVFKKDIDALGRQKTDFYAKQYRTLLYTAMQERNRAEIREARDMITQFGKLSLKEQLLIFIYTFNIRDTKMISTAIRWKRNVKTFFIKRKESRRHRK